MSIALRRHTALEIFNHPADLEIIISRPTEADKYSMGIYRGPEGKFRPLVTSIPFSIEMEDVVKVVGEFLRLAHDSSSEFFKDRKDMVSQILNPSGEINQSLVLNPDRIELILTELREHGIASTYKMFASEA